MLKQYIGDKAFYRRVLQVALPIIVQNGITNFVSMLDNIMVASLGTEQMSGVSIVNQILFVYNLTVFGVVGGIGIFTSGLVEKLNHLPLDGMTQAQYYLINVKTGEYIFHPDAEKITTVANEIVDKIKERLATIGA